MTMEMECATPERALAKVAFESGPGSPVGGVTKTVTAAVEFGARACETFRRWRLERRTARQLSELHDHTLRDIGLSRCDILWISRKAGRGGGYVHGRQHD